METIKRWNKPQHHQISIGSRTYWNKRNDRTNSHYNKTAPHKYNDTFGQT